MRSCDVINGMMTGDKVAYTGGASATKVARRTVYSGAGECQYTTLHHQPLSALRQHPSIPPLRFLLLLPSPLLQRPLSLSLAASLNGLPSLTLLSLLPYPTPPTCVLPPLISPSLLPSPALHLSCCRLTNEAEQS